RPARSRAASVSRNTTVSWRSRSSSKTRRATRARTRSRASGADGLEFLARGIHAREGCGVARTGRRPGTSGTREKILAAARRQFARSGYDRASIRMIAASARVDPKLVHHFYGSKHDLFVAAMGLPIDPAKVIPALLAPGIDGI